MARTTVRLPAPGDFRLGPTIRSHGWSDLPPFDADRGGERLTVRLGWATAEVFQDGGGVRARLESPAPLRADERRRAVAVLGSCLRFDLDLTEFWARCREDRDLAWAARRRAGRMLRAPTAFGDAAMILATTNCSWALTRRIVGALAATWGVNGALPAREVLARVPAAALRARAPLGYRAPYLAALARRDDLEELRRDGSPTPELRARLLGLPGFGPYAAGSMLRLLGRFEDLALDSWVVAAWRRRWPRRRPTDRAIARHFARYGPWKGLALWLSLTRRWYERAAWRDEFDP